MTHTMLTPTAMPSALGSSTKMSRTGPSRFLDAGTRSRLASKAGVSSRLARNHNPTGAMARPRMKGIRHPQAVNCAAPRAVRVRTEHDGADGPRDKADPEDEESTDESRNAVRAHKHVLRDIDREQRVDREVVPLERITDGRGQDRTRAGVV